MNNNKWLILLLCSFSLFTPLDAAHNNNQQQQQSSSSWFDKKAIVTQSCVGIIVGVAVILVKEYLRTPSKSPAQIAREKAEAQIPAAQLEKQAKITALTNQVVRQTEIYDTLCAQSNTLACQKRAEQLADLKARLLELQTPIVDDLGKDLAQLEQKHKQENAVVVFPRLPDSNISTRTLQGN